jgi:hypothetical protein
MSPHLVIEGHDLGHLVIEQAVQRAPAGGPVGQPASCTPTHPAIRPSFGKLQFATRPGKVPTSIGGCIEEVE